MSDAYHPHIQSLRALAVLGPVVLHLWPATVPASPLTPRVTGLGFLGVELFFVISGFLITGILLRARDAVAAGHGSAGAALRAFYARRALRIFPVYWLLLLALAAIGAGAVRAHFGWEFAYLTNVLITRTGDWIGTTESHFWSLAVEEQFYLAWPLVVLLAPRRLLIPVIATASLAAPMYRWYAIEHLSLLHATVLLPACLDVLGLGALLACARHEREARPALYAHFVRAALVAGTLLSLSHLVAYIRSADAWLTSWPLARTGYALVFVALLDRAVRGFPAPWRAIAEAPPVVYLGTISYAVYLFHPLTPHVPGFWRMFGGLAATTPVGFFAAQVTVTVALAALSWHLLEKPVNGLRRHFPYPA